MDILDLILDAAKAHGEADDPDHEVGDLQQLARDLWSVLTPAQRTAFPSSSVNIVDWTEFVTEWLPEEQHGQGQDLCSGRAEHGEDNNRPRSEGRPRNPRV